MQENNQKQPTKEQANNKTNEKKSSRLVGLFVAMTGLALMFFGAIRGEMAIVLQKAIKICLECIGIG